MNLPLQGSEAGCSAQELLPLLSCRISQLTVLLEKATEASSARLSTLGHATLPFPPLDLWLAEAPGPHVPGHVEATFQRMTVCQ